MPTLQEWTYATREYADDQDITRRNETHIYIYVCV